MSAASLITLTTDFGVSSAYVAEMKGVILSIAPQAKIVDITHAVRAQNVREGAFVLRQIVPSFPPGTCHVGVIDPGVGSDRALLLIQVAGQVLLVPDNGLAWPLIKRHWPEVTAWRVTNASYWRGPITPTFHGRDILAPVSAHLANGILPADMGPPNDQFCTLPWPEPRVLDPAELQTRGDETISWELAGEILYVDSFGNLISNVHRDDLQQRDNGLRQSAGPKTARRDVAAVYLGQRPTGTFCPTVNTYAAAAKGATVSLLGSSGYLEVAVVQGNAATALQAHEGVAVQVGFRPPT